MRLWNATSFAELARFDLEGDPPADAGFLGGGTHLAVATHSALKILKLA